MEATPKVHRHRQRRTESRHRRNERQATTTSSTSDSKSPARTNNTDNILHAEEGTCAGNVVASDALIAAVATRLLQEHERQTSNEDTAETLGGPTSSQTSQSQQTVVLVNGHAPQENTSAESHTHHNHNQPEINENNDRSYKTLRSRC